MTYGKHRIHRPSFKGGGLVALVVSAALSAGLKARADDLPDSKATCTLEPGPVHTVARVIDGETVALDDGSELRLIGALAPRARDSGAAAGAWPPELETIKVLSDLVLGRSVKLAYGGRRTDRYGRQLGHLFVEREGESVWVEGELLNQGLARAYGLPENFSCARELLANEHIARDNKQGLWALSLYRPKPAAMTSLLMAERSTFQVVEGKVKTVARTKSATYLNFGDDWKTDFTIRIGKPVLAANPIWAQTLDGLAGKEIGVRGWIERRNGPFIDVTDPGQIEIPDAPAPSQPDPPEAKAPADPETVSTPAAPQSGTSERPARKAKKKRPEPKAPGAVNL